MGQRALKIPSTFSLNSGSSDRKREYILCLIPWFSCRLYEMN